MYIAKLDLINFRNYKNQEVFFNEKTNLLIGFNGQGKTNLIEAIYYLATGKSFRGVRNEELIFWGEKGFKLKLSLLKNEKKYLIELDYDCKENKKLKINGVFYKKNSDLYDFLKVVLFNPDDLEIIKAGPDKRRRYMDYILSINSFEYRDNLTNYDKVLKEKNNFLKSPLIMRNTELDKTYDEQLIHYGSRIILQRTEFLRKAIPLIYRYYAFLTEQNEKLTITYTTLIAKENLSSIQQIKNQYKEMIKKHKNEEKIKKHALVGPHRDDLIFYLNHNNIKKFGSQGQQRTVILALKLAEAELLAQEKDNYPVLLLDDVMSELDEKRKTKLLQMVDKQKFQVLITGTEEAVFSQSEQEAANTVFLIEKGIIKGGKNVFEHR